VGRTQGADNDDIGSRGVLTITSTAVSSPKSPAVLADTTFTAAATGSGAITYTWDFGDGTLQSSCANVVHNFNASGTFNVVLTVVGEYTQ
jgi:PKD repeat protein